MFAWRPVFLNVCSTPSHHANGGLRVALGRTSPLGFDSRSLLTLFSASLTPGREGLKACVAAAPSDREWRVWELTRGLKLATGNVAPGPAMARSLKGNAARLVAAEGGFGIDGALQLLEAWVGSRVHPEGSIDLQVESDALGARGRALVARLAFAHKLCSAASVSRYFHRAKSTFSEQMAASRRRTEDRRIVATPLSRISERGIADVHRRW